MATAFRAYFSIGSGGHGVESRNGIQSDYRAAPTFVSLIVISSVTLVPGWYPDPLASEQLRWWDGAWTGHMAVRRSSAMATGAMTLGIAGFLLTYFPIFGLLLSICATVMAIGAVRQDRDDMFAVSVLSISAFVLSLEAYAFAWSVWIGLYGIVISPSPA